MKKELNLLQKLYTLYNTVIDTVNGYYDILWLDIDIEKINDELNDFQNRWIPSFVIAVSLSADLYKCRGNILHPTNFSVLTRRIN